MHIKNENVITGVRGIGRASQTTSIRGELMSPKLMELRVKIHDSEYLNYAVLRIAQVISKNIVESAASKLATNQR